MTISKVGRFWVYRSFNPYACPRLSLLPCAKAMKKALSE